MYQRPTTDRAPAPGDTGGAATRLSELAVGGAPPTRLLDALAEALLALPLSAEVHVRRWPDAIGDGLAVAYWPGRARSHVAASWDSAALQQAVRERRPVSSVDASELPPGLVGRLPAGTAMVILPLGAGEDPWGVAVVAQRPNGSLSATALESMSTLAAIASLGLETTSELPRESTRELSAHMTEEIRRAGQEHADLSLLLIRVEGLAAAGQAGMRRVVECELHDEGGAAHLAWLADDLLALLLPHTPAGEAGGVARRLVHAVDLAGGEPPTDRPRLLVAVCGWTEHEAADRLLARAMSLLEGPDPQADRLGRNDP